MVILTRRFGLHGHVSAPPITMESCKIFPKTSAENSMSDPKESALKFLVLETQKISLKGSVQSKRKTEKEMWSGRAGG